MGFDFDDVKEEAHSADELNFDALGAPEQLPEIVVEDDVETVPTDDLLELPEDGPPIPENRPETRADEQELIRRGQEAELPPFMQEAEELPDASSNFIPASAQADDVVDGSGTADGSGTEQEDSIYASSPPQQETSSDLDGDSRELNSDLDPSVPVEGSSTSTAVQKPLPAGVKKESDNGWVWPLIAGLVLVLLGSLAWAFFRNLRRKEEAAFKPTIPPADPPQGKVDITKAIDPDTLPQKTEFDLTAPEPDLEPVMPAFAQSSLTEATPLADSPLVESVSETINETAGEAVEETVEATSQIPEWMQWNKEETPDVVETPAEASEPAATWEAMDAPEELPTDTTTDTDSPVADVVEAVDSNPVQETVDSSMTSSFSEALATADEVDTGDAAGIASASALGAAREQDSERIGALEAEIDALRSDQASLANELEMSRHRVSQLEQESHQNSMTVEGLTRQRDSALEQADQLQANVEQLTEELESSSAPDVDVDAIVAERDAALRERDGFAQQRDEAMGKLEAETASLQAALTAAESNVAEANEKLAAASAEEPRPFHELPEYISVVEDRDRLATDLAMARTNLEVMQKSLEAAQTPTIFDDPEYLEVVSERDRLTKELETVRSASILEDPEHVQALEDRDRLANENNDLQRVIEMHEETVGRLNKELDSSQLELTTTEKKYTQSELDLESASNRLAELEEEKQALLANAADTSELETLRAQVLGLEEEKQTLLASVVDNSELDELREQLSGHESSIQRLNMERDEAIARLSEAAVVRDEMELRISEYKSRMSEYDSQVQEVAPLRARIAELESRMHNAGGDEERFASERSDLLEQLQSALQRAASLESTLRETEAEMATIMSDQSDIGPLQTELESQRERLVVQQQSIENREEQLRVLQSQYEAAHTELAALREKADSVTSESESKITALTAENQKFEEAAQWLERERDQARAELLTLQEEHAAASERLDKVSTELQEAKAKAEARAEVALQHNEEQVARLSTERDTAIKAWGRAEQRLTDLQSNTRDHELAIHRLENDNERLARHLEEIQAYRVQLEKSLQDTEQRLSTAMTERMSSTVGDGTMSEAELENALQKLAVVTREKQQILDWLEQSKQENRQLHDAASNREQSVKALQHEREALQAIVDNRSATADLESRKLSQLRDELRVVRQQRDDLETSYDQVKREKELAEARASLPSSSIQHSTRESLEVVELDDSGELLDLRNQLKDRDVELIRSQQGLVKLQRKLDRLERQIAADEESREARKPSRQKPPAKRKSMPARAKKSVASRAKQAKSKPTKARKNSKATGKKTTTRKKTTRRKAK